MLKLGIIGMSEGNGHPYSWAAIFNGFEAQAMQACPFPVIPKYLSAQTYPDDFIQDAKVTHIWTQDHQVSEHIARASKIEHIVKNFKDFIGNVDGVLLARDDWQNHEYYARIFLDAGLPIYIDKPLANSITAAEHILNLQKFDAQIFTCSAFRFAQEIEHINKKIKFIHARTVKSWDLYSIHVIEPLVKILYPVCGHESLVIREKKSGISGAVFLKAKWGAVDIELQSSGDTQGGIGMQIEYEDGTNENVEFKNTFYAFRETLKSFMHQIETRALQIPRLETLKCMEWIEHGKI